MKIAYSKFQSAAEVIILNYYNTVALNKPDEGVSSQERWVCLGTFSEKTQDLQRRRLAFLHSWDYLSLFPLFTVSHLSCLSFFFQQSPSILWGAPRGAGYSSLGRCTPTLSSHIPRSLYLRYNNRHVIEVYTIQWLVRQLVGQLLSYFFPLFLCVCVSLSLSFSAASIWKWDVEGGGAPSMFASQEAAQMRTTGLASPVVSVEIKCSVTEAQRTLMLPHSR